MKTKSQKLLAAALAVAWAGVAGASGLSARSPEEGRQQVIGVPPPPPLIPPGSLKIPFVELYMYQQPIVIRPGEARTVTVTGSVDVTQFNGSVNLLPNNNLPIGPQNPACPIFVSGNNPFLQAPVGENTLRASFTVLVPPNTPAGDYNCALKYTAIHQILTVGTYSVGHGNEVDVPYMVRVPRR